MNDDITPSFLGPFLLVLCVNLGAWGCDSQETDEVDTAADVEDVRDASETPLVIETIEPSPNVINATSDALIRVTFAQDSDVESVQQSTLAVTSSLRGQIPGETAFPEPRVMTFKATGDFLPGERVSVALRGSPSSNTRTWRFAVGTAPRPTEQFVKTSADLGEPEDITFGVAVADVDEDGDLDILFANFGVPNAIWLNDGNAAFSPGQTLGENGTSVHTADLDADGHLDVLMTSRRMGSTVWLGDGTGAFETNQVFESNMSVQGAAIGDVNCDGHLDIFLAIGSQANILQLGDGTGVFRSSPFEFEHDNGSSGVGLVDLDGDHDLDLLTVNNYERTFNTIVTNTCDGLINEGRTFGDDASWGLALGDVNGDGLVDAIVQPHSIWLGDGAGGMTDAGIELTTDVFTSTETGDINGDGALDAFFMGATDNELWLGDGAGGLTQDATVPGIDTMDAAMGDLDGDGDLDLVLANQRGSNTVWLMQ